MGVSSDDADGPQMLCSRIANGTYGTSYVINCFDFKFKKSIKARRCQKPSVYLFLELAALIPIPEIHLHGFARTFQLPEISRCFRATDASGTLLLSETAVLVAEQHLGFERAQLGSP